MINSQDHYAEWAGLMFGLGDAREHLDDLIKQMNQKGRIDEAEFAVHLGHIYAHLNRVWHSRNATEDIPGDQWERLSQYPKDLDPVG